LAGFETDRMRGGILGAAQDGKPRHRADGGQRLAAESQRADVVEIVVGQLGGGVALDRD
jgi:hypothetical protein